MLFKEHEGHLLSLLDSQQRVFRETLQQSFAQLRNLESSGSFGSFASFEAKVVTKDSKDSKDSKELMKRVFSDGLPERISEVDSTEEHPFAKFPSEPGKDMQMSLQPEVGELEDPFPAPGEATVHDIDVLQRGSPSSPSLSPSGKKVYSRLKKSLAEDHGESEGYKASNLPRRVDQFAGFLICSNCLLMLLEFEMEGRNTGAILGKELKIWESTIPFRFGDALFDFLFLIEFGLQILANGRIYFSRLTTIYDVLMATGALFDLLVVAVVDTQSISPIGKYMMRALNSLRVVRLLKALQWFSGVHLLLRACQSFTTSLFWAMVLLTIFMVTGSLMVGNLLSVYVMDDLQPFEDRVWIWSKYGTAYRSLYSFYEITFAGSWPAQTRPVLEKVSQLFSMFWVCYITIIVFALIRDTLDAAHNDAELQIAQNMQTRQRYVRKLEDIFNAIDDGDGMITEAKLQTILINPKVRAYFQTLDLDVCESNALFHLLDDGDGEVTMDEFINGILRCKGTARAIDQVALHTEVRSLDKKLTRILQICEQLPGVRNHTAKVPRSSQHGEMMKHFRLSQMKLVSPDRTL